MNREQLDQRFAEVLRRHARVLDDHGGVPSPMLLAELAGIADEHSAGAEPRRRRRSRDSTALNDRP